MIRAAHALAKVWRGLVILSLILNTWPLFVTPVAADVGDQSFFTLTKTANPSPVLTSSLLQYTLTFTNDGEGPSETVTITDTLPSGVTLVSIGQDGALDKDIITWTWLEPVAVGASSSVTFTVQTGAVGGQVINESYGITSTNAVTPTQGQPVITALFPSFVIINEIMQNPSTVDDSAGEWLELYNPTTGDIDINGWTIRDDGSDSHVINNGGPLTIPAGGYLVLARNGDFETNGGVEVDYVYSGFVLANSIDEVILADSGSNEIDRVEYDDGSTFPDPNGASIELVDPMQDNNSGTNWLPAVTPYGYGDLGTPGRPNGIDTLPPFVRNTTPGDNATNVELGVTIQAIFNEDMDETTVTAGVFALEPPAEGAFGYNNDTNTLTFDPATDLAPNTVYTATITGNVTDQAGNSMGEDYAWNFTTGEGVPLPAIVINEIMQNPSAASDDTGEWFELYNAGSETVNINGWTIRDNDSDSHIIENGGPLNIAPGGYLVLARDGDPVANGGVEADYVYAGFVLANSDDEVFLLDGDQNEIDRVEYTGSSPWPDPNGASMALQDPGLDNNIGDNWATEANVQYGAGDYGTPGWENGTQPADTEPPHITSRNPKDGETGVDVNTNVSATFDEAIDESTLGFTLGGSVPGTVSYDSGSYTATFNPDNPLVYETTYTATIAAGLQDMSGNATAQAFVWSFTTGSEPTPASVLISELQVRGTDGYDEFIELYNPSATESFNLNGYRISYQASSGGISTRYTWDTDTLIPSYGHYLLVNSTGYNGAVPGDDSYSSGLADDGAIAIVRVSDDEIIDSVGWGSVDPVTVTFVETAPAPGPGAEQSIERLPGGDAGNMSDTNDNSADFVLLDPPNPQNTASPPTPAIGPELITIAEARNMPDGTEVIVEGIATAPTGIYYAGTGNSKFYIQDGSGGAQIQLFGSNGPLPKVTLGDRVLVQGETGHYQGEFRIVPQDNAAHITITDGNPGDVPAPAETAIADVGKATEGWLIALEGLVVDAWDSDYGFNVRLSDEQGHETEIYVEDMTAIDTTGIVIGLAQRFTGISTQYDTRYQTKPRIQSDVPAWPSQQGDCPAPAATAPGPLLISAVHYDTLYLGYDELAEAVQVINTGDTAISLAGYHLSDNETSVALPDLALAPGQKAWLARDAARFTLEFGFAPDWDYGTAAPELLFDNAGDEAVLLNSEGAVIDALIIENGCAVEQSGWSDASGVYPYLFASYVSPEGQILYRKLDETTGRPIADTGTTADWAQDPGNSGPGNKMLYPGWDLDQFFFPATAQEQAETTLLVAPDNLYEGIAALIDEAQSSIDIQVYLFSHPLLADKLIEAMNRGVQVRLLLEGEVYRAPGGTYDDVRWVAKQIHDHPNGQVWFWRDGTDDEGLALADRYNNVHQKFMIIDGTKIAILSENLKQSSMPADDKSDGTGGHRGAAIVTTAPGVVVHLQAVLAADLDPANHRDIDPFTPGRDDIRHEEGHEGEPLVRPELKGNITGYMPVRPDPLVLNDVISFEVVQSPDTSLRVTDALLGMVARAGAGDLVLAQQQYEHQNWGPYEAQYLNPRLNAYIEAARRGAVVRIMVANNDDNTYEDELIQYLNDLAAAEGLDLMAGKGTPTAGLLDGQPEGGHIHSKMVLVYEAATQGWVHVGSINGSENSSRYNREVALQLGSNEAFNYYAGLFHADWVASGLPDFLAAPVAAFEASTLAPVVGETVQFTNTTTGSAPIIYEWDFGDGSPASAEVNPSHIYDAPETFVVTLRAVNAVGESFATVEINVEPAEQPLDHQYAINLMAIRWHHKDDRPEFMIDGHFTLPSSYSRQDLSGRIILSIEIAGQIFWQELKLIPYNDLWYLLKGVDGQDLYVQNMGLLWRNRQGQDHGRFLIIGELDMPDIGPDIEPPEAAVTLKLLTNPGTRPFYGQEDIEFRVKGFWWLYSRWDWQGVVTTKDDFENMVPWDWEIQ